ncbi:cyclic lactone autoinducer peptide [Halobacillus litoralis]|nr:cyclic lactone autoinducer peptide [Halobacillus litoralis]
MKEKVERVMEKFIGVVTEFGVSCGEAALHRSCFAFLYEPEVPEELQDEEID